MGFKYYEQNQLMIPMEWKTLIDKNDVVFVLNDLIDNMNIDKLLETYSPLGNSSYPPKMMLKILMYGYIRKRYSSRQIAEAVQCDIKFIWLAGGNKPTRNVINSFRKDKMKIIMEDVFVELLVVLEKKGYINTEEYFVDGTKIEVNANKYTFVWKKSVEKYRAKLQEQVHELMKDIDELNEEDKLYPDKEILCMIPDKKFILAYSDNPDGLLHKYGTTSEEVKEFIKNAEEKIEKMSQKLDDDTLLIISADHGHKDIEKAHTLLDYPEIQECLIIPAYLESRVLTFWVKESMKKTFEERFNKEFEKEFWLMTKEEFLDKYHFLGYGKKHNKIDDFIGNYVALSVAESIIRLETFLAEGKPVKKSTHCGLSKEEMEVPVIVQKK